MKLFVLATMSALAAGACSGSDNSADGAAETTASTLDSAVQGGAVRPSTPAETTTSATENSEPAPRLDSALPVLTPEPGSGYELAPGGRALISIGIHCGVRVLDWPLNERVWQTSEGASILDWVPHEWPVDSTMPDGPLMVEAHLSDDGDLLTLSLNERDVLYETTGTEYGIDQLCE